jgi:hypothetical protein
MNKRPAADMRSCTNARTHQSPCLVNGQLTKKTGAFRRFARVRRCKYCGFTASQWRDTSLSEGHLAKNTCAGREFRRGVAEESQ